MSSCLLNLKAVSERLGMPVASIYALLAPKGDLACVRTSLGPGKKHKTRGRILVKDEDIDAWIERHRIGPRGVAVGELTPRGRTRGYLEEPATGRYA